MGQNNQKDQKGPKMTAAVMLLQNNQKNWSLHISHSILKVRFFWDTLYIGFMIWLVATPIWAIHLFTARSAWVENANVKLSTGLHKLWYPVVRDMSTWSKFGAHGEHGDVFLFSNLGALWFSENLIRYSLHVCLREVKNNLFSFKHSYLRHFSWRF